MSFLCPQGRKEGLMIDLKSLVSEDEEIRAYYRYEDVTNCGAPARHYIIAKDSDDAGNAIEDTLHRILDAGGTERDVFYHLGAVPKDSLDDTESEEAVDIDLGYVLPSMPFFERQ